MTSDSSNFEHVTGADLRPGDHVIYRGKLVEVGDKPLGFRDSARVSRLRDGVDPETVRVPDVDGRPHRHLGVSEVAAELGVAVGTVTKWVRRYPPQVGTHPVPTPDVDVCGTLGWAPRRIDEWRDWRDGMPGRGAGGGRPRRSQPE